MNSKEYYECGEHKEYEEYKLEEYGYPRKYKNYLRYGIWNFQGTDLNKVRTKEFGEHIIQGSILLFSYSAN